MTWVIKMEELKNMIITDILQPSTVHSDQGKIVNMRGRKSYGLSLCISGQITYTMHGTAYVSTPGCAVLLPKGGNYSLHGDKEGLFPLINFDCQGLALDKILVLPLSQPQACLRNFEEISSMFLFNENRLRIFSAFYELLSKILQQQESRDDCLQGVLRFIETKLSDPSLSNNDLAHQAGLSEVYLRKLFTERYGISPKQYILDIRIRKAKQLLCDSHMTVTAIAEACGFNSLYHFCRAFKKLTGATPTQYAQANRDFRI